MPEITPPIAQLVRNYSTNLPAFPPDDPELRWLHGRLLGFYRDLIPAANSSGIAANEQSAVCERVQKTLWTFSRFGQLSTALGEPVLDLLTGQGLEQLKFPRLEETLRLMATLGMPVELCDGAVWSAGGKLKGSDGARLRGPLAPALKKLAAQLAETSPKEKAAYERFLRVNPRAILAREKPGLEMAPDAPAILANLPEPAAQAWLDLTTCLAAFDAYAPGVEFRSIHQGMWVVNYESKRSGRDLCGLIVQNSEVTARIILYRAGHLYVKERLAEFGDVLANAFHRAHYYEEFQHQWLFVPVKTLEDTPGIKKLLAVLPALHKQT